MKFAILFLLVGVTLTYQALVFRGACWLLLWPALSFFAVASAYVGLGPRVFGKQPDGSLAWYSVIALFPYLLLIWLSWHTLRIVSKEPPYNEVISGLIVGRRLLASEMPEECMLAVDLTSEFVEPKAIRTSRGYLCVPMLDGAVPLEHDFLKAVEAILKSPGPVFVHCAQGHGRSGMVAAAVLVATGKAANADEALKALRAKRPRIDVNRKQLLFLKQIFQRIGVDESQRLW